ncbi:hypothetical protein HDU93_004515 [Gonapodya sp. JEL0774]|nr:hypothetical protein HDU93_004515 [Gonapodya sp. JEL0774]
MTENTLERDEEKPAGASQSPPPAPGFFTKLPKLLSPPHLPAYRGPHEVGVHDIEIAFSSLPDVVSTDIDGLYDPSMVDDSLYKKPPNHNADTVRQTVFMRVYYPTTAAAGSKRRRPHWQPSANYAKGLGSFAKLPAWASYVGIYPAFAFTTIPVFVDEPVLSPPPATLPVVVFSHGLAGNRTMYSDICGEMASRGTMVVSLVSCLHGGAAMVVDMRI